MKTREKGMPKYCYRRKDSPYLWYKFKVNGVIYTASTETTDTGLAGRIVSSLRTKMIENKLKDGAPDISFRELINREPTDSYRCSVLNVVKWLLKEIEKDFEARNFLLENVRRMP